MQDFVEEIDIKKNFQKFWEFFNKSQKTNKNISSIYNERFYIYQKRWVFWFTRKLF